MNVDERAQRDDEAAAQVYEDFVRDFGDSSAAESARASGPPRVPGATSAGRPRPTPIFGAFGEDASPPREEVRPRPSELERGPLHSPHGPNIPPTLV